MIARCSETIITWLIKQDAIKVEDKALYEYAVYSLLLTFSPLILILVFGFLMGKVKESALLILPFMLLRKFSGGFHAKHDWTCLIGSCGLLFLCVYAASNITCSVALSVVTFGAVIVLCLCSPIDSENRRLALDEKKKYKLVTCMIAVIFAMVFVLLMLIKADTYAVCIAIGLILSAGLQLPCIVQYFLQKIK